MFTVPAKKLLAHAAVQYANKANSMQDRGASNAAALALFLSSCVAEHEEMTFEQARAMFAFCMCGVSGALVGMFEPPSYAAQPAPALVPGVPQDSYAPPQPQYAPPHAPQRPQSGYADSEVRGPNGNLVTGGGSSQGGGGPGTKTEEITDPATGTVLTTVNGQPMGQRPMPAGPLPDQVPPIFGGL